MGSLVFNDTELLRLQIFSSRKKLEFLNVHSSSTTLGAFFFFYHGSQCKNEEKVSCSKSSGETNKAMLLSLSPGTHEWVMQQVESCFRIQLPASGNQSWNSFVGSDAKLQRVLQSAVSSSHCPTPFFKAPGNSSCLENCD